MTEIECPHCHTAFKIDESGYAEILKQVHDKDFEKQLEKLPIAQFPKIKPIVVPAYNMPGGRSRFFRYIWNLGTGV